MKTKVGDSAWILSGIASAVAARPPAAAAEAHGVGVVAAQTGLSIELLNSLFILVDSGALAGTATRAMKARLARVRQVPPRLMDFVRPESLEGLFGDAYKTLATDHERALQALGLIDRIRPIPLSGAPLSAIEAAAERKSTNLGSGLTALPTSPRGWPQTSLSSPLYRQEFCLLALR